MGENCRLRPVPRVAIRPSGMYPMVCADGPCGLLRHSMMKMAVDESASIGAFLPPAGAARFGMVPFGSRRARLSWSVCPLGLS